MGPLTNQKQERFCLHVIKGYSDTEAYSLAGYKNKEPGKAAFTLRKNTEVVARIAELQSEAKDETVASVLERKRLLTEIMRESVVANYITTRGDVDLNAVRLSHPIGVAEYAETETVYGAINRKIKVRDPITAIKELNQMERIYTEGEDHKDQPAKYIINVVSPDGEKLIQQLVSGEWD